MVPIECGEAIEGVDLQAAVIAALEVQPGHRVLEVGTGSGFTAAVMARLGGRVVTLDRYKDAGRAGAASASRRSGIANAFVRQADGGNGLPGEGPFDRIVAWAAFDSLPRPFVDQLSTSGIMIAPIGPAEGEQVLAKLTKIGSRFEREDIATVRLQPIVEGWPRRSEALPAKAKNFRHFFRPESGLNRPVTITRFNQTTSGQSAWVQSDAVECLDE